MHREDLGAGIAVFLRRHRSPFPTMQVVLKRIAPDAQYEVSLSPGYAEAPRRRMSGADLARLTVSIPEAPGSVLLRYTRDIVARHMMIWHQASLLLARGRPEMKFPGY